MSAKPNSDVFTLSALGCFMESMFVLVNLQCGGIHTSGAMASSFRLIPSIHSAKISVFFCETWHRLSSCSPAAVARSSHLLQDGSSNKMASSSRPACMFASKLSKRTRGGSSAAGCCVHKSSEPSGQQSEPGHSTADGSKNGQVGAVYGWSIGNDVSD